jgi:chemotaxis protein MotA
MVGTLVGMAMLLQTAGQDVTKIGGGLSIAMMATLYGILAARLLCLPAADKLLTKEEARRFRYYMLAEGLSLLAEKQNPLYVQDRLNSFLDPSTHFDFHQTMRVVGRTKSAVPVAA